ncbi:MAG: hypothetical protein HZA15_08555 [Nitrospirae bacterium]|nr:hypothetical protein [Nitrospirota bacterium]
MQNIPISLAAAGMVLAKEIKTDDNPASPPICGKGVTLTASLINRLAGMGVQSVVVEGHPVRLEGEKTLAETLEILDKRFAKVSGDQLMQRLREIYRKQIIRSLGDADGQ